MLHYAPNSNCQKIEWQQAMPNPILIFAFIVATVIGAGFHLIVGGDARRLALFLLAGWFGFALGHSASVRLNLDIFTIGDLHIVTAALGAGLTLIATHLFTSGRPRRRSSR